MTDLTARVLPPAPDARPEPGKMPDLYVVRSWVWDAASWRPNVSGKLFGVESATELAARLRGLAHVRVEVVLIPGDAQEGMA